MVDADPPVQRFGVSHVASDDGGWVELLAMGLTFDCRGLSPAMAAASPTVGVRLGLSAAPEGEAIEIVPGPHLAQGGGLIPIVRMQVALGAALSQLPGAVAVVWQPARCWMDPTYFRKVSADWLAGGAFPALGLTMLESAANGALVSHGLSLFTGQELYFEPNHALSPAATARIATRLIDALVQTGPVTQTQEILGPDGQDILLVPVRGGEQVRVKIGG